MVESRPTSEQRKQVMARAGGCCEYCLCPERFAPTLFSVEHIIPRAKGGKTTLDNLAFACQGCNNHKYTKTQAIDPVNGELIPLFHPVNEHPPLK